MYRRRRSQREKEHCASVHFPKIDHAATAADAAAAAAAVDAATTAAAAVAAAAAVYLPRTSSCSHTSEKVSSSCVFVHNSQTLKSTARYTSFGWGPGELMPSGDEQALTHSLSLSLI